MALYFDREAAKRSGYSDSQIDEYLNSVGTPGGTFGGGTPMTPVADKKPSPGILETLISPVKRYGQFVGEAAAQGLRFATDKPFRKSVLGQQLTPGEAEQLSREPATYFLKPEEAESRGRIVKEGLKRTAGAAAYAVPFGRGTNILTKILAPGAAVGGLAAAGEEGATPGSVVGGAAGGAALTGLLHGAGSLGGKALRGMGETLQTKAAAKFAKTTPAAYAKIVQESGRDINSLVRKYVPANASIDDMVGPVANKGRGGIIRALIEKAEGIIQQNARVAGGNIRIGKREIAAALGKEAQTISRELGGQTRSMAMNKIVYQAKQKYANGVSVKTALNTLRAANEKFGASILETEGSAVASAAQKLEANMLRSTLKGMFPELAQALDTQADLLTLRPILNRARAIGATEGRKITPGLIDAIFIALGFGGGGPTGAVAGYGAKKILDLIFGSQKAQAITGKTLSILGKERAINPVIQTILGQTAARTGSRIGTVEPRREAEYKDKYQQEYYGVPQTQEAMPKVPHAGTILPPTMAKSQVEAETERGITFDQLQKVLLHPLLSEKTKSYVKTLYELQEEGQKETEKLTTDQKALLTKLGNADNLLNNYERALSDIGLKVSGPKARLSGSARKMLGAIGLDPKVKTFGELRKGTASMLAKSLGEVGNLAEGDVQRAIALIPEVTDSQEEARLKLQMIRDIIQGSREGMINVI